VASLIALIPFNYYYTSSTAIEFKSFTKCNRRFDEMNELLNLIDLNNSKKNNNEILDKMIERNGNIKTVNQIILDYLDLCAEEYYLYKYSGIISRKVWEHWLNGMLYYFVKGDIFHQVILKERKLRENSYYGFIKFILKKIK
jgi:hypothetical protein